ncbi:MAG TPA: hypothetical protein VFS43_34180 [Polyangiaceae bacterium]|nr:hypothetical protein [Polyangiaceae bacterium]
MTKAAVATVSVRLIRGGDAPPGEGRWPSIGHARVLEALMGPDGDTRGGVPLWADYRQGGRCLDVQYGAPPDATGGPGRLWPLVAAESEALWVRSSLSAAPFDTVSHLTAEGETPPRLCRYGFDEVRIRWAPGSQPPPLPPLPVTTDGGTWHLRARGSYLTGNDRGAPDEPVLGLPSPTTWVHRGCPLERLLPEGLVTLGPVLRAGASRVDYFYHGRLVHRSVREAPGQPGEDLRWREYSLDDWDNCLDRALLRLLGRPHLTDDVYEGDERAFGGQLRAGGA